MQGSLEINRVLSLLLWRERKNNHTAKWRCSRIWLTDSQAVFRGSTGGFCGWPRLVKCKVPLGSAPGMAREFCDGMICSRSRGNSFILGAILTVLVRENNYKVSTHGAQDQLWLKLGETGLAWGWVTVPTMATVMLGRARLSSCTYYFTLFIFQLFSLGLATHFATDYNKIKDGNSSFL